MSRKAIDRGTTREKFDPVIVLMKGEQARPEGSRNHTQGVAGGADVILIHTVKHRRRKGRRLQQKKLNTPDSTFEIETPTVVAGVCGTDFMVEVDPETDGSSATVFDGEVEVGDEEGRSFYIMHVDST